MKQCLTCNRTYDDSLSFCLMDGTPLTTGREPETLIMRPVMRRKVKLPLVLSGVVLLVITGFAGWFLFRNSQIYEGFGNNRQRVVNTRNQPSPVASLSSTVQPQASSAPDSNQNPAPTNINSNSKTRDVSDGGLIDAANSSFDNPQKIKSQSVVLQFRATIRKNFSLLRVNHKLTFPLKLRRKGQMPEFRLAF
jgi:hypothetical protein